MMWHPSRVPLTLFVSTILLFNTAEQTVYTHQGMIAPGSLSTLHSVVFSYVNVFGVSNSWSTFRSIVSMLKMIGYEFHPIECEVCKNVKGVVTIMRSIM